MRYLWVLVVLVFVLSGCTRQDEAQIYPRVHYEIQTSIEDTQQRVLDVAVTFTGKAEGQTEVVLGLAWADEQAPYERFLDVTAIGETTGAIIAQSGAAPQNRVFLTHQPNENITLRYRLSAADSRAPEKDSGYYYAPVLNGDNIHLIGWTALAVPNIGTRDNNGPKKAMVSFDWKGLPSGWVTFESFDKAKPVQLNNLFQSFMLAGEYHKETRDIDGKPLSVFVNGDWSFDKADLADRIQKILIGLNTEWGDAAMDFHVSLLPVPPMEGVTTLTGTALHHSFTVAATDNFTLDELSIFLAHEIVHDWVPARIGQFPNCEGDYDCTADVYWLTEGFTDFVASHVLKEIGLWDTAQFADYMNEALREYYRSPMMGASNIQIAEAFWSDPDAERQPYLRGFLLAQNWNAEMKAKSGEVDLMRGLRDMKTAAETVDVLPELTMAYIDKNLSTMLGRAAAPDIERHIVGGAAIAPRADILGACYTLKTADINNYDLGFAVEKTLSNGIFQGVKPQSNAYAAGVRDGMIFIAKLSGGGGDTTVPIVLKVQDGDEVLTVSYIPIGETATKIPQFTAKKSCGIGKGEH